MTVTMDEIPDINKWIETGELNLPEIEVQLDWIVENGLAIIDNYITSNKPEEALASFVLLNAFLSAAAAQKPSLVKKLSSAVQTFKATAEKLGKKLKVDSVSIAVGFPWGVSINLSWDI